MARAVGIDIGSNSLKILQIEKVSNKLRVTKFFSIELPLDSDYNSTPELLIEPINQIFKEYNLERNNVVLSIPTQNCILREIAVDFTQDEHIKKIIKYEAEKYVHSYSIENVIIDYQKLSITEKKAKLFVVAVPKPIIAHRLGILGSCDIDPISVDLDISALATTVRFVPEVAEKKTVILIDLGATSTKIIILYGGRIQHVRATRLGVSLREIPEEVVEQDSFRDSQFGEIDWDIEDKLIVSLPVPDGMPMERMVLVRDSDDEKITQEEQKREVFKRLLLEIRRTLLTVQLDDPVELICLTGGGTQLSGIQEFLQQSLDIETKILDLSSTIPMPEEAKDEISVGGGVAFGLALKAIGESFSGMEFRKEEFSYTNRFELIKMPAAVLMTLLFMLILLLCYHVQKRRIQEQQAYDVLVEKAKAVFQRAMPEDEKLPSNKKTFVSSARRAIQKKIDEILENKVPPVEDILEKWRNVSEKFKKVKSYHDITITDVEIEEDIDIKGLVEEARYATALNLLEKQFETIENVDPDVTRVAPGSPKSDGKKRDYDAEIRFKKSDGEDDE